MLAALLLAATVDLNPYGIYATIDVPAGAKVEGRGDGTAYVLLENGLWAMIERRRFDFAQELAIQKRFQIAVTSERGENGTWLLQWDDKLNPPRKWSQRVTAGLSCRATGNDLKRADAICKSLELKRTGEILRVVALDGPSIEGARLTGAFRVELDGLGLKDARLSMNGKPLTASKADPATFELGIDGVEPRMELDLAWEAAKTRGHVALPCPGKLEVLRPKDGSDESPAEMRWTPAQKAVKHSVELASWDPVEKVALPGSLTGWGGADNGQMSSMLPEKPPYRLTFTAYGPESTGAQTPSLSCRVVRKVYTK